MTAYYTKEKAKFGGTTGTILPFTVQLPLENFPDIGNWKTYVPAGYLRCDGGIYLARLFPSLAAVIGTGSDCRFAKDPDNLDADFFQLPDLGSKYIRSSTSSGQYFEDTVTTNEDGLQRVGAQVRLDTLIGNSVTITYTGQFEIDTVLDIPFLGNPIYTASDNDGKTFDDFLSEDYFQAHGHDADVGVFHFLADWSDSGWVDNGRAGGTNASLEGTNELVQIQQPSNSINSPTHNHQINLPSSTELRDQNNFRFTLPSQVIDPIGLQTEVTLTTENIEKLDNAVSPFMFMEYIIKI